MLYKPHSVRALIFYENKLLVLKRAASDTDDSGLWDLPGGAIDKGETVFEALKREVFEETGLKPSHISVNDYYGMLVGKYKDVELCIAIFVCKSDSSKIKLSSEHDDYQWISLSSLKGLKKGKVLSQFKISHMKNAFLTSGHIG